MTLIRHPFRFFSAAIRCFVYKKNKQQVYLFDLEEKKGKALERGQRLEALLPKGWSRRLHDYPYRPLHHMLGPREVRPRSTVARKEVPGI